MPSDVDSNLPPLLPAPPRGDENYAEALNYLYGRINYEKIGNTPYTLGNYRLDRMRQLLENLGNPHHAYEIVHVAGTKGKGTTSTLIADCLVHCGLRTGLYTSPHLLRLEERIQFQGNPCSPQDLIHLTRVVRDAAGQVEDKGMGRATFFELTTAMGMLHFANCQAQLVLLEVGLGGRLDSTNVCSPVATVITSISLDHQAQLGNTIDSIAREKAGIIKPDIPLICSARAPEARRAITGIADERGAACCLIERDYSVLWSPLAPTAANPAARANVTYLTEPACGLEPPQDSQPNSFQVESCWTTRLLGRHQADNIGAALATLKLLRQRGWQLPLEQLQAAISRSQPRARLEVVANDPLSVIDSAHNPASIQAGLEALADHFPQQLPTIVFAASRDKDWQRMLELLLPRTNRLILTAYLENPRGLPLDELSAAAQQLAAAATNQGLAPPTIETATSPALAWRRARETVESTEIVYATGSFFLAAEIIASLSL